MRNAPVPVPNKVTMNIGRASLNFLVQKERTPSSNKGAQNRFHTVTFFFSPSSACLPLVGHVEKTSAPFPILFCVQYGPPAGKTTYFLRPAPVPVKSAWAWTFRKSCKVHSGGDA
jgi:hypothetical protein